MLHSDSRDTVTAQYDFIHFQYELGFKLYPIITINCTERYIWIPISQGVLTKKDLDAMASAIIAIRKSRTATVSSLEDPDEESLLENLIPKIPPREVWEAEFCLEMLVAG